MCHHPYNPDPREAEQSVHATQHIPGQPALQSETINKDKADTVTEMKKITDGEAAADLSWQSKTKQQQQKSMNLS